MENFTTDRERYLDRIIEELTAFEDEGSLVYCEVGQLLSHGFSFWFNANSEEKVKVKTWDSTFDNERFKLGVFNLDRLAIAEVETSLNQIELNQLNQLIQAKLETKQLDSIVLDGLKCQLQTKLYNLEWNVDDEMNDNLRQLVHLIRNKKPVHNTR